MEGEAKAPAGVTIVPCTIAANTYLSTIASFKPGSTPVMLTMPSGWEPSVILTIQISVDGTNFFDLMNPDGTPLKGIVHPGAAILLQNIIGWAQYARLRSGPYDAPVPQLQDRVFQFMTQP